MKKRVALITGGTSGIGLDIARKFSGQGFDLALNGLEKDGEKIAASLTGSGRTVFVPGDITSETSVQNILAQAEKLLGPIDILVNSAGIQHVSPIEQFEFAKWSQVLSVNLSAAFLLSKYVWPSMKKNGFGRIIHVASVHGLVASEFKAAYVAAKHGLLGLNKVLALEGAPFGITSNAICPGYVKTPLVDKQIDDQARAHGLPREEVIAKVILAKHAIKDFVPSGAISDIALFLAGDNSASVTGSEFTLDGGWTAQ